MWAYLIWGSWRRRCLGCPAEGPPRFLGVKTPEINHCRSPLCTCAHPEIGKPLLLRSFLDNLSWPYKCGVVVRSQFHSLHRLYVPNSALTSHKHRRSFCKGCVNSWSKSCKKHIARTNDNQTRSQFCACHDNWAVMTCAKLRSDRIIIFQIKTHWLYARFGLWLYKPLVTWILGLTHDLGLGNLHTFKTLRPRQNGRHFPDDIFKWIFLNENVWISINISLKFVPMGLINNIPILVQVMAWRRPGDKPLSEPMMVRLPTHICVTRPQWVNSWRHQAITGTNVDLSSMSSDMHLWQFHSTSAINRWN